jgi:hypothetical protein
MTETDAKLSVLPDSDFLLSIHFDTDDGGEIFL